MKLKAKTLYALGGKLGLIGGLAYLANLTYGFVRSKLPPKSGN